MRAGLELRGGLRTRSCPGGSRCAAEIGSTAAHPRRETSRRGSVIVAGSSPLAISNRPAPATKPTEQLANPFRPGNGVAPPYLAGRDRLLAEFEAFASERPIHPNWTLTGLRGTGKTVLLSEFATRAERAVWVTLHREVGERHRDTESSLADLANARAARAAATLDDGTWATEAKVVAGVERHLKHQGWRRVSKANAATREAGIDLVMERDGVGAGRSGTRLSAPPSHGESTALKSEFRPAARTVALDGRAALPDLMAPDPHRAARASATRASARGEEARFRSPSPPRERGKCPAPAMGPAARSSTPVPAGHTWLGRDAAEPARPRRGRAGDRRQHRADVHSVESPSSVPPGIPNAARAFSYCSMSISPAANR